MKTLVLLLTMASVPALAQDTLSNHNYSVGLGMGAPFSGLGANFALVSDTDMKYISAGCSEYSSRLGWSCGAGAGWIVTNLFDAASNKHGLGVYISKAGQEEYYTESRIKQHDYYGAGLSYTYFMRGINKPGFTFGASIHASNAKREDKVGGFIQVGYQF